MAPQNRPQYDHAQSAILGAILAHDNYTADIPTVAAHALDLLNACARLHADKVRNDGLPSTGSDRHVIERVAIWANRVPVWPVGLAPIIVWLRGRVHELLVRIHDGRLVVQVVRPGKVPMEFFTK